MSGFSTIAASAIILSLAFTISLTYLDYGLNLFNEASSLILNANQALNSKSQTRIEILNVKFKVNQDANRVLEVEIEALNCGEKALDGSEIWLMDVIMGYLRSGDLGKEYRWIPSVKEANGAKPYWNITEVALETINETGETLKPNLEALNPGVVSGRGSWDPGEILTIKISFPNNENAPYYSQTEGGKFTLILVASNGARAELNFTDPQTVSYI